MASMASRIREAARGRANNPLDPTGGATAIKGASPLLNPTGGATAMKGLGGGSSGAPAPGAPAGVTPPVDSALDAALAGIRTNRDTTVGQLEAQRPQLLGDYGYTASGYDQNGAPTGLSFDTNNPYSRAALLLKNYGQQQAGTRNGLAAQGQLNSGAYARAKRSNESGYTQSNDALLKALTRALTGVNSRINTTKTSANAQIATAILSRAPQS